MKKRSEEVEKMIDESKLEDSEKAKLRDYKKTSTEEETKLLHKLLNDFESIPTLLRKIVLIENLYNVTFNNLIQLPQNKVEVFHDKSSSKTYENKNAFEGMGSTIAKINSFQDLQVRMQEYYATFEKLVFTMAAEMKLADPPKANKKKRSKIIL